MNTVFQLCSGFLLLMGFSLWQEKCCANTNQLSDSISLTNYQSDELIEVASAEMQNEYERATNSFSTKELLSIAMAYIGQTNLTQAIAVYKKILEIEPKNRRAVRGLGQCFMLDHRTVDAIRVLKVGADMGDVYSLVSLAEIYCFFLSDTDNLNPLIPKLMEVRARVVDGDVNHDTTNILLSYLLQAENIEHPEKILSVAINGLDDGYFAAHEDTACLIKQVYKLYSRDKQVGRLLDKYKILSE